MAATYDFIIIGSGPAGCSVAAGLSKSPKKPKVLLIEAGGKNEDRNMRVDGQRWLTYRNKEMNWGYKSVPQEHCGGREMDYSRGRGLGGSSAINFSVFNIGASGDYDEWARQVGDDAFAWPHMQRRYKNLETFDPTVPPGVSSKYVAPKPENHGFSGPLKLGYVPEIEKDVVPMLDLFEKARYPLNPDHNSGNPLGMALSINTSAKGYRSTAKDLLEPIPDNLTIVTDSPVQRILLEGKKAVGVESNGKKYYASKEVILSAGALDAPKILMHSGIGPKAQLEQYGIPVVQDTPAVGQGLRDRMFVLVSYERTKGDTDRDTFYGDKEAMDAALEQWKKDGTGPWSKFACDIPIGWAKIPKLVESKEFQDLPEDVKAYMNHPTVPHTEIVSHFPGHWSIPDSPLSYSAFLVFLYNAQCRGEVTLQSADPNAPLRFDPRYLSTAFDRRAAIEALRDAQRIFKLEEYARNNVSQIRGPAGDSDEDYLDFWRQHMNSCWHMTGTLKMGRPDDPEAVVDSDFRVRGFRNLRVADMSVVPVLASCHTQSVAYLTGLTAADKLLAEYGL
ncbi:GMC oxidoreductase [Hypoxylon sp. NC1633]|nr:GMC oxidoreductase [Hypoxylon sp. NC1633]